MLRPFCMELNSCTNFVIRKVPSIWVALRFCNISLIPATEVPTGDIRRCRLGYFTAANNVLLFNLSSMTVHVKRYSIFSRTNYFERCQTNITTIFANMNSIHTSKLSLNNIVVFVFSYSTCQLYCFGWCGYAIECYLQFIILHKFDSVSLL